MEWRKSTFSQGASNCVEVGWRKSAHSNPNGACIEVGEGSEVILVRDTQQRGFGTLSFSLDTWTKFTEALKA